MKATKIKLADLRAAKWGLVTVLRADTTIERQYRITGEEAEAVHKGALPPDCSKELWDSGLVMVGSRPCLEWDAVVNPDGSLVVNYGIREAEGSIQVSLVKCQPSEWKQKGGVVYLDDALAKKIGA